MSTAMLEAYRLLVADVYELAGASRSRSEELARQHGSTAARWHVLSVLTDEPATVPAVARRLGLSRQAVQRVVNDLVANREVRTRRNAADARAPLVTLTAAGRRTAARLFEESDTDREAMLARAGVSRAELDRARDTVRRLAEALQSAPPS